MKKTQNSSETRQYIKSQKDICLNSELFTDKNQHGSKIIMLFAEIFSFIVEIYGLKNSSSLIIQYSNTKIFKEWFWRIKHDLGELLGGDPSFYEIGKWIGKGFFLKICISLIMHHNLFIEETMINKMINRQKKLLKELASDSLQRILIANITNDSYMILREKTILSYDNEYFFIENVIK